MNLMNEKKSREENRPFSNGNTLPSDRANELYGVRRTHLSPEYTSIRRFIIDKAQQYASDRKSGFFLT
jgi:hypothetical protein